MINFADIIKHLNEQVPDFWRLATAVTFVMGLFFAFKSFFEFKIYGEMRVMMSYSTNIMKPLSTLIVAVVLLFWPDVIHHTMYTFFQHTRPYSAGQEGFDPTATYVMAGHIVQIIGFVAFIRGWVLLARAAHSGGQQPGMVGKGITHLIGGIFAVNIFETWRIIQATFGISS
ncbi:MAG: type IV secretion protein IcmC [Gammaproteobacteria bacterium]